ncbi:MAG: hypothetical protein C0601_01685, partial [Candidatus Muiribacterium halophilum]
VFEGIEEELKKIDEILDKGLENPIRVYFTDSMLSVMLHTTSFAKKIIMLVFLPIWYRKAKKYWNYSKGWLMKNSIINSIVLKTAEGLESTVNVEKGFSKDEFVCKDTREDQRRVFLHQYIQALLSDINKPEWLEEGLSYYTMEKYYGSQFLKDETLEMVQDMPESSIEDIIFSGIKGYWMVKYIEKEYPNMINELLKETKEKELPSIEKALFERIDGVDDKKQLFEKAYSSLTKENGVLS